MRDFARFYIFLALFVAGLLVACRDSSSPSKESSPIEASSSISSPITIRVLTYNIHHGEGTDGKIDLERIAKVILDTKADIVGLQEIDRGVQRTGRRDLIAELSHLTGMEFYFDKNVTYQGGDYGNAVLTRFPILEKTNTHFKMLRPREQRGVQQVLLDIGGHKLMFLNTHIDYREDDEERRMNVVELRRIVEKYKSLPIILCGDFNDTPGSRTHTDLKEFVTDTWEIAGYSDGFTLYSDNPTKRIDYIWMTQHPSIKLLSVTVPVSTASDHLPVLSQFEIE